MDIKNFKIFNKNFNIKIGGRNNNQKILNAINLYNYINKLENDIEYKIIKSKGCILIYKEK